MNQFKIWYSKPVPGISGINKKYGSIIIDAWDYTMAADIFLRDYWNHVLEIIAVQSKEEFTTTVPITRGPFKNSYRIHATVNTGDSYCTIIDADNEKDAIMAVFCMFKSRRVYGYITMQVVKKSEYKGNETVESTPTMATVNKSVDVNPVSSNVKSPLTEIVKLATQNGSTLSISTNSHKYVECSLIKLDEKEGTILVKKEDTYSCIFLREVAAINVKVSAN